MDSVFKIHSAYQPAGDQPAAIRELLAGLGQDRRFQTLLGVTGSGKTFSIAHVIAGYGRPALVIYISVTFLKNLPSSWTAFLNFSKD